MHQPKFASVSVRHKTRPVRRPSFRDDNLVGLRYEKTVAAEPPIPMAPRSPLRASRPTTSSSSSVHSHSPVVISPPRSVVEPPAEEHPALRTPTTPRTTVSAWKRDSGHAPNSAAATIYEEDCEDELLHKFVDDLQVLVSVTPVGPYFSENPSTVAILPEDVPSVYSQDDRSVVESSEPQRSLSLDFHLPLASPAPSVKSPSVAASSPPPSPRKLGKSFSFRSISKSVLGRKSISEESTPSIAATLEPLVRGSSASTKQASVPRTRGSSLFRTAYHRSSSQSVGSSSDETNASTPFSPLVVSIPTDSLLDDDFLTGLSFSNRGSILFAGQGSLILDGEMDAQATVTTPPNDAMPAREPNHTTSTPSVRHDLDDADNKDASAVMESHSLPPLPDIRVLAADVEQESQKVRSLYDGGQGTGEDEARPSTCEPSDPSPEASQKEQETNARLGPGAHISRSASPLSYQFDKTNTELAGGLEDWEDVDGTLIDRYGFIVDPRPTSRLGTPNSLRSTQFSTRKRNVLQKRNPRDPAGLSVPPHPRRSPSRKVSARSLNTQHSGVSVASFRSSRSVIRHAGNLLPYNRDRRWLDDAGDMLSMSPSLQDIAEEVQNERISEALKRKEGERSEKWRKMAKVIRTGDQGQGQGMEFQFDTKNPKLIDRTWKGIPDRWRGAAWWSFMAASAKKHQNMATNDELIAQFHRLQDYSSGDDGQIDMDVPRTIGRHIMFRRRYRGGQRLMFRVLHAISLYFPETGYGQGMASLAATLLCYFDEERCFVMMVRMWELRGLKDLYHPKFSGLMAALKEFESCWLNKDVAKRLVELDVDVTSYGTKWYLTLFNLSVPFPAQLRIWDVFLLLGDGAFSEGIPSEESIKPGSNAPSVTTGLDVLHAASAALVQALREMILDSDFENAMKALTSHMAIRDEDLLMKVMKAEYKAHSGRRRA
ncbi:rab-GTPase-TBC domain-containing protein [Stachybotrys elegans]|uniref:Rab-GTPase-TBC domain-containing protein n=1 Tax=Stachybotrys elegans TaxID=80388 RepID=A0A8K0SRT5_9HYPO|nr:rab-GTPase-TBC domain-containing protein [Stachybotrys elegans]